MRSLSRFKLLYILLILAHCCFAQTGVDSFNKNLLSRLQKDIAAYKRAVSIRDSAQIAESCYLIGKRQIGLGNYAQAQKWLFESLKIQASMPATELKSKVYLRMHEIQFILGNLQECMKYARLGLQSAEETHTDNGLMSAYSAVGSSHLLAWELTEKYRKSPSVVLLDSAIYYHTKSLMVATKIKSMIDIGVANQHLGRCWYFKNEPAKNSFHKKEAINIYQKLGLVSNILEIKNLIANEYLGKNDPKSAKPWLDQSRLLIDKHGGTFVGMKISLEKSFAEYYQQIGDWKNALSAQRKISEMNEAHFIQYRNEAVEGIRKTYDYEIKKLQIESAQKEIALLQNTDKVKNRFLIGILLLLAVAAFCGALYGSLYLKYKKVSAHNAMLIDEQSHRTKNSLQAISSLLSLQMFKSNEHSTSEALQESLHRVDAINLVHQKLHKTSIPLFVDMPAYIKELIDGILLIHKMKVTFRFSADPIMLHAENAIPLGLIINELATNACKYGLSSHDPVLSVSCHWVSGQLCFEMKDNGKGFNGQPKQQGFGMDLIENLSVQLKGKGGFQPGPGCHYKIAFPVSDRLITFNPGPLNPESIR